MQRCLVLVRLVGRQSRLSKCANFEGVAAGSPHPYLFITMLTENPLQSFIYCPRCGAEGFADHGERAKHCAQCGLTYYANIASAVACLVLDREGRALLTRRVLPPAEGTLDLPGGFVDPLETVETAVRREIREETGLEVASLQYLMSLPNIYPYSGVTVYTSDLFFLVRVDSFDGARAADDAAELVVRPLDELNAEDFGLSSIKTFIASLEEYLPQLVR